MNTLNEQRAHQVADQLFSFSPSDATPTNNFAVEPEYTLIAHLPDDIGSALYDLTSDLRKNFPEHYYYLPTQYHLTIVPIPHQTPVDHIVELIEPLVKGWNLPIHVRGLAVNRLQASTVLYPENESLIAKRQQLRSALGISTQAYTIHHVVWDELLWANFMRFKQQPTQKLIEFLQAHSKTEIEHFTLDRFELYEVSTKTLDPASSKLLHTFIN